MTRKKNQEELFDEVSPGELEEITKELNDRVAELVAMVKLAKISPDQEEVVRQIARIGIRSFALSDRVKYYAKRLNLEEAGTGR